MSMILSFLGGAAGQLTSDIEQAEKNSREDAKLGFAALTKRYEENAKANRELTSSMEADKQWITTTYENATPAQIAALVGNPVALEALKKTNDPYKIDLSNYIKIAQGNQSPAVQAERIQALPALTKQVASNMEEKMGQSKGSPIGGLIKDFGDTEYEATMGRMAKSQGMSMADLQATSRVTRPTTGAKFNMAAIDVPKNFKDAMDTAKLSALNAEKTGDPVQIDVANKVLNAAKKVDADLTDEQKAFNNKLGQARTVLTDPKSHTPDQVKKANEFYNNWLALEKAHAEAVKKGGGDGGSAGTPKLGTLNTFASGAVAQAVSSQFGAQVKDGKITFSTDPTSGEVRIGILSIDPKTRLDVAKAQLEAAQSSLKNYLDPKTNKPLTTAVSDVIGRYEYSLQVAQREYDNSKAGKEAAGNTPLPMANAPASVAKPVAPAATPTAASTPLKQVQPSIDVNKERAMAAAAIKAQPQNADSIKASYKVRTGQEYK